MVAENSATRAAEDLQLAITRTFDAPRALVFKAWTEPDQLARWWGPQGFTLPSCKMEFRPGGAYRFHMRGPDGVDHFSQGVFREIVEPARLVFSGCWATADGTPTSPQTLVTVTFDDDGGRTRLTLQQAFFETVTARDAHRGGWSGSLERLAEYLATA